MSVKRQATSELNHENWDDDDPSEDKSMGQFRAASKDVLEKRVIRTAKRRNPISTEASKSVFSGFGGFNKTQKTSFDFLANLTNGSKNTNGSTTTSSSESATSSSLFTNKPAATSGGLFGAQSSSITSKPLQTTTWSSPFGSGAKTSSSSLFSANTETVSKETPFQIAQPNFQSKPAQASSLFGATSTPVPECKTLTTTTNSSSFKIQPISNTTTATVQTTSGVSTPSAPTKAPEKKYVKIYHEKLRSLNICVSDWISKNVEKTPVCILTPIFNNYKDYLAEITKEFCDAEQKEAKDQAKTDNGANATKSQSGQINSGSSTIANKDTKTSMVFGINNSTLNTSSNQAKESPFAINNSSPVKTQDSKATTSDSKSSGLFTFSNMPKQDTKSTTLFGVNSTESKQESKSTPFALNTDSTPKKSEDTKLSTSFGIANNSNQDNKISSPFAMSNTNMYYTPTSVFSASPKTSDTKVNTPFAMNTGSSPFNSSTPKPSPFGVQNNSLTSNESNQPSFSFGIKTSSADTSATKPNTGFSFGVANSGSSLFSSTSTPQSTTSFSFGTGKPFSFSTNNVQQSGGESAAKEEPESEEPPKVEYTPVKEENSVYDKKCKIFVKKDGNFVDKGVGTLYLKTIEGNAKHQLLVRANTNLGTVLVNLVLSEGIPIQRMGKNNVMMVCIPTPDAKPPPTPILIRVKTGEEADELLGTLNKHKG